MKCFTLITCTAALALPMALTGCDREVAHTSEVKVKSDGTVKQHETTVRETPDGTIIKEESKKVTNPNVP